MQVIKTKFQTIVYLCVFFFLYKKLLYLKFNYNVKQYFKFFTCLKIINKSLNHSNKNDFVNKLMTFLKEKLEVQTKPRTKN